jgi:hypothetical protein
MPNLIDRGAIAVEVERAISAAIARRYERRYGSLVGRTGVTMAAACAAVEKAVTADNDRRYAARERVEALTAEPVEFAPVVAEALAVLREAVSVVSVALGPDRTGDDDGAAAPLTLVSCLVAPGAPQLVGA